MKILIISAPRTGSSSLAENLKNVLKYKQLYLEPYLYKKQFHNFNSKRTSEYGYPLNLSKNSIVKTMTYQVPSNYGENDNYKSTKFELFISDWSKEFNKIILLSRKNEQDHLESWINLLSKQENGESVYKKWNINEIKGKLKDHNYVDYLKKQIKHHTDKIKELSKLFKLPISFYEDLYGSDRKKSLEIIKSWNLNVDSEELNKKLDPKFKLRQPDKNNTII
jgi:hypothetical protein